MKTYSQRVEELEADWTDTNEAYAEADLEAFEGKLTGDEADLIKQMRGAIL